MKYLLNFPGHPGITGNGGNGNDSAPDMNRTGSSENNANSDATAGKVSSKKCGNFFKVKYLDI